ncbi:unnamed protein product [Adineta ricciae]|uniref:Serine hydrolase domain-containing protein n=1 Tax=Adineta ricciae TaxID=249248 RepID=A0A815HK54_ADIRI|nr:unnamed protein product [Adineta ricciae]CAF1352605.1 unnamed protein product [Adineta ricciae]
MATNTGPTKTRILVLHGFYDSAQNRQYQMRNLARSMKEIEFVFIDAPFQFVNYGFLKSPSDATNEPRYQWFSYRPEWDVTSYHYDTNKESIEYVINYINSNGPFDGLLGFSQGAIVCVTMMLNIPQWPTLPSCVKFIIFVGCPPINDATVKANLEALNQQPDQLPTLHVSGLNDTLITREMSEEVCKYFNPSLAEFYTHKGGHYCPSDADFRQKLREFIIRASHP